MTHDEALALFARRQELYREHDAAGLASLHAPDGVVQSPLFPDVTGRSAIEASYRRLFTIFPDWEITFDAPIIDGHRVAQPFVARATHVGEFMGVPGTGRRMQFHGALICRLDGDCIAEERRVYDFTGLLIQLGVLRGKTTKPV